MHVFNGALVELTALIGSVRESFDLHEVCDEITIPQPNLPKDELFFTRLVAWTYVLLNEAFPLLSKKIVGVMRQSAPVKHKHYQDTKYIVECFRAFQSHNLPPTSKRNEDKIRDIKVWHSNNSGSPFSWETACVALSNSVSTLITDLRSVWTEVSSDEEDKADFVQSLCEAFEKEWPAYRYDAIVERSATALGLTGFNSTEFRKQKGNVEAWKKIAELFDERSAAEAAVERVIKTDLLRIFGP